jgi:hypothetical protein
MMTNQKLILLFGCGLFGMLPLATLAADNSADATAERCVALNRVSNTEVIDDQNILFHMRGGDIFVNRLPYRCPGLRRDRVIMYRTSAQQLCDLDVITVLDNTGFGFTPGPSCGLGRFYPVSKEEADKLKKALPDPIKMKEPESAEVEDVEHDK